MKTRTEIERPDSHTYFAPFFGNISRNACERRSKLTVGKAAIATQHVNFASRIRQRGEDAFTVYLVAPIVVILRLFHALFSLGVDHR